jgi:hypothetical protein
MVQANHKPITRRRVIAGAATAAATAAVGAAAMASGAAAAPLSPASAIAAAIRRLMPLCIEAECAHGKLVPGTPEEEAADAQCNELFDRVKALHEALVEIPPRTLDDVRIRAELTRFWGGEAVGIVRNPPPENVWERATLDLVEAVLQVVRAEA